MAIKDWVKESEDNRSIVFLNKKKKGKHGEDKHLIISKYYLSENVYWQVLDAEEHWGDRTIKEKLSKPQAVNYAKSYMRKH